jgi:hypothetical protein
VLDVVPVVSYSNADKDKSRVYEDKKNVVFIVEIT